MGLFGKPNGGVPKVALAIGDQEPNGKLRGLPVDMLELRLERFRDQSIKGIEGSILARKEARKPMMLGFQNGLETGSAPGINGDKKLLIYHMAMEHVDAVDIELDSPVIEAVMNLARENEKTVIVSSYFADRTPGVDELETVFSASRLKGADVVKITAHAKSMDDVFTLLDFTRKHRDDGVIPVSMGPHGALSRLLFPAAGSLLTYCCLERPSAPGEIPMSELVDDLRRYYPKYR